jgi:hypothetical protein
VAMLIPKNSNHNRARDQLQQHFALGTLTEDIYPNTEDEASALIDYIDRNSNGNNYSNNNNNDDGAVVAAHSTDYMTIVPMMTVLMMNQLYLLMVRRRLMKPRSLLTLRKMAQLVHLPHTFLTTMILKQPFWLTPLPNMMMISKKSRIFLLTVSTINRMSIMPSMTMSLRHWRALM